jgi:hypothetical protein
MVDSENNESQCDYSKRAHKSMDSYTTTKGLLEMKASPLKEIKQENSEEEGSSGSSEDQVECSIIYNIAKDSVLTIKRPELRSGLLSNETSGKGLLVGGGAKSPPKKMISTDDSNLVGIARQNSVNAKENMSRRNSMRMESRLGMVDEVNLFKEPGSSEELNKYFSESELEGSENESYKNVLKKCVNLARESSQNAARPIKFTMPHCQPQEDSVQSMEAPKFLPEEDDRDPASYEQYHYDKATGKGDRGFEFSEMEYGPGYSERFGSEQYSTRHGTPKNIVITNKSAIGGKKYQKTKTSDTTDLQACHMSAKTAGRHYLKLKTDLVGNIPRDSGTPKSKFFVAQDNFDKSDQKVSDNGSFRPSDTPSSVMGDSNPNPESELQFFKKGTRVMSETPKDLAP